jgi:hypothetical protein
MAKSWERHIRQVEDDQFGQYLLEDLTIYCPYCGKAKEPDTGWELQDYYVEMPPLTQWLKVFWQSGCCYRQFNTDHRLNEDGFLKDEVTV